MDDKACRRDDWQSESVKPYGPLRGRGAELEEALSVIRRGHTHHASGVVLVSGNAGIGKTAFLTEICRQAAHLKTRVARSKCDEIAQAWPGAPILGLLRTGRDPLLDQTDFQELTRLTGEPLLLVDAMADHLGRLAGQHHLLIAIDDVQWADPLSRYAIRALISRLVGRPVVWLLATRAEHVGLTVGAADVVGVEHIRLNPLASSEIAAIARDRLGRSPGRRTEQLLAASAGNPFLATQILDGLARSDNAREFRVPVEFTAAVRQRVVALTAPAQRIIEVIATAGRPVPITDTARLSGMDLGPAHEGAVATLTASGLVANTATDLYFVHDLIRDAVYAMTPTERRSALHAQFARYLSDALDDPVLAATHAGAAARVGDHVNAAIMITGAETLIEASSAADAADLAVRAYRLLRRTQSDWLDLAERVVAVLARTQRAGDAVVVANALVATVEDLDVIARIETHAAKALWLTGRYGELVKRAERNATLATARPDLVARFEAARALALTRLHPAEVATQNADRALTQAQAVKDSEALAFALHAAGEAANSARRHNIALSRFRELRVVTRRAYVTEEILEMQLLDRYDDADSLLQAARVDNETRKRSQLPDLLYAQLKQDYNLGRLAEADDTASTLIELGQIAGITAHVLEASFIRAAIALYRGEPTLAEQRLQLSFDVPPGHDQARHPGRSLMHGWLLFAQGEPDRAHDLMSPLLDVGHNSRNYWGWWPCWLPVFVRVGLSCGAEEFTARAVEIAEHGARHNPDVATLSGLAINLRGQQRRDLGMLAESMQILAHSPRPSIRSAGAVAYGRQLLAAGDRDTAMHVLDSAWDDLHQMGAWGLRNEVQRLQRKFGVRRAKWVSPGGPPSAARTLSEAERRVAYLVCNGHTNKSAAKELGLSVNTVGSQLRAVYAKLNVRSRVQLSNALRDRGELAG